MLAQFAEMRGAEIRRNVSYGDPAEMAEVLDVSVPSGAGPFPVAILVHGGGWTSGDKSGSDHPGDGADISAWFQPLTDAHFTWFSINYRLAPEHPWPAAIDDVQTAIRWVKAHAAEYKGDPRRIALFGHSAGGHLVCLAAVLADDTTRVQAVLGFAPVTDFEFELPRRGGLSASLQALFHQPKEVTPVSLALLRKTAPISYVKPGLPPFLLLQGDADRTVPIQETLNFQAKLQQNGDTADLIVIHGAPHRLLDWSHFDATYPDRMLAWLNKYIGDGPTQAPPPAGSTIRPH